jgi:tRNA nucleotidyltransferase (CCA-adding enzyme)
MGAHWEHYPHGADIGVRGVGWTKAEAFEQAALALVAVIVDDPTTLGTSRRVEMRCEADDDDVLLVDWLNEVIYAMAVENCVFGAFRVTIEGTSLRAIALGEPVDVGRHAPAVEVKGATFTDLRVARRADGTWLAQCIVDV